MSERVVAGVDRAAFAAALTARLRSAGVPVGLTGTEDLVRALAVCAPDSLGRLYWAARVTLVRRHDEVAAFDAVFDAVFGQAVLRLGPRARSPLTAPATRPDDVLVAVPRASREPEPGQGLPWATLPPQVGEAEDSTSDVVVPQRLASALEALAQTPFEQLSETDLQLLEAWIRAELTTWPTRRSRRRRPGPGGRQVALRPTMARSRRTGFEPVHVVRVEPVRRRRRVVMLCDVSQSMQAQVPAYLHLMRALTQVLGGEAFAFATTLTRLTPALRHRSAAAAVERATEQVTDRFGGTRIAQAVTALLASPHASAVRGGIVVIASDGWGSDEPAQVAAAMARLRRRAHRVVWVNPRASAPGFEPLVGTMAAALPSCDQLLAAGDVRSLARVVTALAECSTRG